MTPEDGVEFHLIVDYIYDFINQGIMSYDEFTANMEAELKARGLNTGG